MTFNITTSGTTPFAVSPQGNYIAVVEGTFDGATVSVSSGGGVLYLPWREGDLTIATPDASEFRAVNATGQIVVATAGASTDLTVSISKINPNC